MAVSDGIALHGVKLSDFGLVTANLDSSTRSGRYAYGSRSYASPELSNCRSYTEKTDIYSLGVVFFELLFVCATRMELSLDLENICKHSTFPTAMYSQYPIEVSLRYSMRLHN